jgi:2-oxoglutarate dehydrogenase complex dehydrogenase (E1) component-like enzyme
VRILRIEQLYPFPIDTLKALLGDDPGELVWIQEEPRNMGAYQFISERLAEGGLSAAYIGRDASASPATGSSRRHKEQQAAIVDGAFAEGRVPR